MKKNILILIFLSSCMAPTHFTLVQGPSVQKQRQKIALLQRKKELVEKEQMKVKRELDDLDYEIDRLQLAVIQRKIGEYEGHERKGNNLFIEEREALCRMIDQGPSPAALQAQAELDRILRLIQFGGNEFYY